MSLYLLTFHKSKDIFKEFPSLGCTLWTLRSNATAGQFSSALDWADSRVTEDYRIRWPALPSPAQPSGHLVTSPLTSPLSRAGVGQWSLNPQPGNRLSCTLHTAHYTPHTTHCTLYTTHRTLHTAHCTLP